MAAPVGGNKLARRVVDDLIDFSGQTSVNEVVSGVYYFCRVDVWCLVDHAAWYVHFEELDAYVTVGSLAKVSSSCH
ncbi:hypothetical protein Tco_0158622 [Tanacetum coccineum]